MESLSSPLIQPLLRILWLNTLLENTKFENLLFLNAVNITATESYQCSDIFVLFPPKCIKL